MLSGVGGTSKSSCFPCKFIYLFFSLFLLALHAEFSYGQSTNTLPTDQEELSVEWNYEYSVQNGVLCGGIFYFEFPYKGDDVQGTYTIYRTDRQPFSIAKQLRTGDEGIVSEAQAGFLTDDGMVSFTPPGTPVIPVSAGSGNRIIVSSGAFTLWGPVEVGSCSKPEDVQQYEIADRELEARTYQLFFKKDVAEPSIDVRFTDRREDARVPFDEELGVSMVIEAGPGDGDVTDIALTPNFVNAENLEIITEPTIPATFSLKSGEKRSFDWLLKPKAGGRFRIVGKINAKNGGGVATEELLDALEGSVIGDELTAKITLDPPNLEEAQTETIDGEPEPFELTATLEVCNNSSSDITDVTIRRFRALPRISTPIFPVTRLEGGPVIDPISGFLVGTLEPQQCQSFEHRYRIDDDVEVEVDTIVDGVSSVGSKLNAMDEQVLSVKPKFLLDFNVSVIRPAANTLLPAGEIIQLKGTVKNLSNSDTLKLGPLFPELAGNAGTQSLTWDAVGVDPERFEIPEYPLELNPGEQQDFHVRIVTMFSDPLHSGNPPTSSGARADITFTPWAIVVDADGVESDLERDQIKASDDDFKLRIAIDDSHPIPEFDYLAVGGGIMYGSAEAAYYFSAGLALGLVELVKLPVTVLWGAMSYQSAVWDSFTEEEKTEFAEDTGYLVASVLLRNAENAKEDFSKLTSAANEAVYRTMEGMANDWEVGNHADTIRGITRYTGEFIGGEVAMSLAFARLAKSAKAAAALERADSARQIKNAGKLNRVSEAATLERVEDVLFTVEDGVLADAGVLEKVMGYLPEETQWIQKTCLEFKILCVSRSRAVESIKWVKNFAAKLKPEAIKAKTVSALDEILGYPKIYGDESSVGAMVFKKPEALVAWETKGGNFGDHIVDWVTSRGIPTDHPQFEAALRRIALRADEWKKYEKVYKQWNDRKYIDTSFNFSGNGVSRETLWKLDPSLRKKGLEKAEGFRMRALHPEGSPNETYLMELFDAKLGKWRPITGDVDFLAFTHRDGTSLSQAMHAKVLKAFSEGPLGIRHPESATFLEGGIDFIKKQLKPLEAAVMFGGPDTELARFVRLDSVKTLWEGSGLYKLNFKGGYKHASEFIPPDEIRAIEQIANPGASVPAPAQKARQIPKQAPDGGPNVGRCDIRTTSDPAAPSVLLGKNGRLVEVDVDGLAQNSALHDVCFAEESGIVSVKIAPGASIVLTGDDANTDRVLFARALAGDSTLSLFSDESVVAPGMFGGLEVGQIIAIGVETETMELREIISLNPLTLDSALNFDHGEDEVIVVVVPSSRQQMTTTDTDADGIPDIEDFFPNDPNESNDNDYDGIGDISDTDDDNDGYTDDEELAVLSDPTDPSDTPSNHQPDEPVLSGLAISENVNRGLMLSYSVTEMNDPDQSSSEGTMIVRVSGPADYGVDSVVYQRSNLAVPAAGTLTLPVSTLTNGSVYRLQVTYQDATGLLSDESLGESFVAPQVISADANLNSVDDLNEFVDFIDLDSNGTNDHDEGAIVLMDSATSNAMTLTSDLGSFTNVVTINQQNAVSEINSAVLDNDLASFRLDYLEEGQSVTLTLSYATEKSDRGLLLSYDPMFGFQELSDATVRDLGVTVGITDGAAGDLDGVANGRIVGALATGIADDEIPDNGSSSSGSGGGGCVISNETDYWDPMLPGLLGLSLLGIWVRSSRRGKLNRLR